MYFDINYRSHFFFSKEELDSYQRGFAFLNTMFIIHKIEQAYQESNKK